MKNPPPDVRIGDPGHAGEPARIPHPRPPATCRCTHIRIKHPGGGGCTECDDCKKFSK